MLNLTKLHCNGDPEMAKKYNRGVKLAISLAESTPGQFKLIESPVNSFLIVTNLTVEDTVPHATHPPAGEGLDFSCLSLSRLNALDAIVQPGYDNNSLDAQGHQQPPPAGVRSLTKLTKDPYVTYKLTEWMWALRLNKDILINQALKLLGNPSTWTFCHPTDPLPWMWLLFYGPRSRCQEATCVYAKYFSTAGPVLLPPFFYDPGRDIQSFMSQACKFVKYFYDGEGLDSVLKDNNVPFDDSRIAEVLKALPSVSGSGLVLNKSCLLCCIYKQNLTSFHNVPDVSGGCLILQGAERHTDSAIGRSRCQTTGDIILWPSYNINSLVALFKSNEPSINERADTPGH
ncbi:ORF34 [Alcelaphine gammaherpesvirus 1]|uniref:Gene 34 protein n=1 Tax=Alcelaphine herpesvirus 1 (strain C500) TaxID=654901 RepID=UL95_ALHV1|nr:ORF34 [Alcelaphine gammaherpesvirus 1]O36383.1 RecName: Full=Gene 34 protein [Alcelaphine herpesvirus 1 strain C500]AAC58080.1 ORF34 [Alcelaphine gammaherpesvirus 1]APB09459.1 protein UL95 [Alcelaphine gammaherpesvirus 1]APB09531.1 protein UL95 [Alcelaphine gammaherpesvirus 1]ATI21921.1 ORF34 [Alcelaphine gammaherpesvirus 1]